MGQKARIATAIALPPEKHPSSSCGGGRVSSAAAPSLHKEKAQAQLSRVICLLESARKLSSSFGGASPVLLCIGTQTVQFAAHATVTVACQR